MVPTALDVAELVAQNRRPVAVVDPRWVVPLSPALVELAASFAHVVVIEDNLEVGGVGSAVRSALAGPVGPGGGPGPRVQTYGIPRRFIDHGSRAQVLEEIGLTADRIGARVNQVLSGTEAPELRFARPTAG